ADEVLQLPPLLVRLGPPLRAAELPVAHLLLDRSRHPLLADQDPLDAHREPPFRLPVPWYSPPAKKEPMACGVGGGRPPRAVRRQSVSAASASVRSTKTGVT